MARILLIKPNLPKGRGVVYQCTPPLGLMYIAALLRKRNNAHQIKIIDMIVNRLALDDIKKEISKFKPEICGFSCLSLEASNMHRIARTVKELIRYCHVVVGGPHASAAPEVILKDISIDSVVTGEGEETMAELVERVEGGESMEGVKGVAYRKDNQFVRNEPRPYIQDLDSHPFPAWDLIEMEKYFRPSVLTQNDIRKRRRWMVIFTSRACPYGCIFCHNIFGKKYRGRKPENVFSEIQILYRNHGIREFHIIDDTFNLVPKRAKKICDLVIGNGMDIDIAFPNGLRGDLIDDELLSKLKEAGTYKINFGIESATDRIQKIINKRLDINRVNTTILKAVKAGLFTHGWFMLGFPTETKEEMIRTIEFACNSRLHTAGFNVVIPFPATHLYDLAKAQLCLAEFDFDNFNYRTATMNLSAASLSDLRRLHKLAHRKFYFNPNRLARIFLGTPNKLDIIRNLRDRLRAQFF